MPTVLVTRRDVDRRQWMKTIEEWQAAASECLSVHPWRVQNSAAIVKDLRGGPLGNPRKRKKR